MHHTYVSISLYQSKNDRLLTAKRAYLKHCSFIIIFLRKSTAQRKISTLAWQKELGVIYEVIVQSQITERTGDYYSAGQSTGFLQRHIKRMLIGLTTFYP